MRQSVFSTLADAILNRVSGIVANVLLRRATMHAAQAEAADLAATEEQLRQFNEQGHKVAAMRLEAYLQAAHDEDPSRAVGADFAKQLLADDFNSATAPGESPTSEPPKPRIGRPPKRADASA